MVKWFNWQKQSGIFCKDKLIHNEGRSENMQFSFRQGHDEWKIGTDNIKQKGIANKKTISWNVSYLLEGWTDQKHSYHYAAGKLQTLTVFSFSKPFSE